MTLQAPSSAVAAAEGARTSKLRWAILALLFAATVLNYVDRQTLSILASQIQKDLGIDGITESVIYAAGVGCRPPEGTVSLPKAHAAASRHLAQG